MGTLDDPSAKDTFTGSSRTMFTRTWAKICALIFNSLHKELRLYQEPDCFTWTLDGSEFSIQLDEQFIFNALSSVFAHNPDEIIGDGYVNGEWIIEDGNLEKILGQFWNRQKKSNRFIQIFRSVFNRRRFKNSQVNSPTVSQGNIRNHYDAENPDNILFEQLLGEIACYSSALFDERHQDLSSAQQNKLRIICEKMRLKEGTRTLDIGSGWGELARLQAEAGCDTTGITVSYNQLAYCTERYKDLVSQGKLRFEFSDYRDFFSTNSERFDSISCIEVLDHIGLAHFNDFFEIVFENLDNDGSFFLQVITRPEPGQTSSWIDKHIYPGGYIASLKEIEAAYIKAGFECYEKVDFSGYHYATTLREWRKLLVKFQSDHASSSLFTPKFFRKWEFFLASSIVAFEEMGFANSHIILRKSTSKEA